MRMRRIMGAKVMISVGSPATVRAHDFSSSRSPLVPWSTRPPPEPAGRNEDRGTPCRISAGSAFSRTDRKASSKVTARSASQDPEDRNGQPAQYWRIDAEAPSAHQSPRPGRLPRHDNINRKSRRARRCGPSDPRRWLSPLRELGRLIVQPASRSLPATSALPHQ